jgi:hypothetical protein
MEMETKQDNCVNRLLSLQQIPGCKKVDDGDTSNKNCLTTNRNEDAEDNDAGTRQNGENWS